MISRHFSAFGGEMKKYFQFQKGFRFLDLTLGDGGHTEEALNSGCQVVSFDLDSSAIDRAKKFLAPKYIPLVIENYQEFSDEIKSDTQWIIVNTNFTNVADAIKKLNLRQFDGILVDLGPSQYQILTDDRGFSFESNSPLDMRLDKNLAVTAKDLVNGLHEGELRELLEMSDEPFAKVIARIIVSQRKTTPIITCKQLADLVSRVKHVRSKTHPATQTFMALRMAVNLERENISALLAQIPQLLKPSGLVGIISFHSGEDKIIKDCFLNSKELCVINKKPFLPSSQELQISNRTRSAKLRLAQKHS